MGGETIDNGSEVECLQMYSVAGRDDCKRLNMTFMRWLLCTVGGAKTRGGTV